MPTATVTSKGQITIPAEIRTLLNLKPGDKVHFVPSSSSEVRLYPKNGSVQKLKGMLGPVSRTLSIDDMHQALGERAAEMDRRSKL